MTTAVLPSRGACCTRFTFLLALLFLHLSLPVRAAQETFWPFNLFPPPAWSLANPDASASSAGVPTVGTITSRYFVFTNFSAPLVLPGPGSSATLASASTTFNSESSLDGGATWAAYTGVGATSLTLRNTNDTADVRRFEIEFTSENIAVNGAYGAATVRESPALASLGELVVTATNGGFLYRGFADIVLEVSVDDGANWFPMSPAARLGFSGPAGAPAVISISRVDTTLTVCWRTEVIGEYQLQRTDALGGSDWTDVDSTQVGNGSEVCVTDEFSAATNQFYRVRLLP